MFRPHLRFGFVVLLAACITGCGGSGGTTTGNTGGNGGSTGGSGGGTGGSGGSTGGSGAGNSTTVTVTFDGSMPTVVAAQIGTGAYTAQTLTGNTLTLTIPSGTTNYAVAYLCPVQTLDQPPTQPENVYEVSTADTTSPTFYCSSVVGQTGTLTGSLDATAISGAQYFGIYAQNDSSDSLFTPNPAGPTASFSFSAPSGSDRVLVLAGDSQGVLAAKNFDNQTVPGALSGGNTVTFTSADEVAPQAITYNDVPSGFSSPGAFVLLQSGPLAEETVAVSLGESSATYPQLPASATKSGDAYDIIASAQPAGSSSSQVSAGTVVSGGPVSFTFPAPWNYTGPTAAALPAFTYGYTGFAGKANVEQEATIQWNSGTGSSAISNRIAVNATDNYQNGSTTIAIPDLSGITGFLASPASGTQVSWTAAINQSSNGFATNTPLNATWSGVQTAGSYTVP